MHKIPFTKDDDDDQFECQICSFISSTGHGLKVHMCWKHKKSKKTIMSKDKMFKEALVRSSSEESVVRKFSGKFPTNNPTPPLTSDEEFPNKNPNTPLTSDEEFPKKILLRLLRVVKKIQDKTSLDQLKITRKVSQLQNKKF